MQKDHYLFSCAAERGSKPIVSVAESFIDFALVISSNFQRTLLVVMTSNFANLFGGRRCVMFCFDTRNFTFSRFTLVRTVQIRESIRGKNCNTTNKYNGYGTLSNLIHKNQPMLKGILGLRRITTEFQQPPFESTCCCFQWL